MTRIKICGITNREDYRAAVDYGTDAVGFVGVPDSPRYIGPHEYLELLEPLTVWAIPFVSHVIVSPQAKDAMDYAPQYVQFYEGYCGPISPGRSVRAFRIRDVKAFAEIEAFDQRVAAYLLDAYHPDKLGGSGETFNWDLACEVKARFGLPIILAGGLTPENVGDAIAKVRPYAVDVSSGVEAEPGRKDHAKLKAFIKAVRMADAALE